MTDEKDIPKKFYSGECKPCGCPIEDECDHIFSGFRDYCLQNPGAPECKIFDL
jgi:hypothetical protein